MSEVTFRLIVTTHLRNTFKQKSFWKIKIKNFILKIEDYYFIFYIANNTFI